MKKIQNKIEVFAVVSFAVLSVCNVAQSSDVIQGKRPCGADYDISSIKDIHIEESHKYASNEIEIIIDVPIDRFFDWLDNTTLDEILGGGAIRPLNNKNHREPGHRRIVCNYNGDTVVEEIIENIPQKYFSYKVWNYSNEVLAGLVEYAKGEFWYAPRENKTHIRWQYSFKLKRDDEQSRGEFESNFIRTFWNDWMTTTLGRMKMLAEKNKS